LELALSDPVAGLNMGQTAELLARERAISREVQDAFALRSHTRAAAAASLRAEEIIPVFSPAGPVTEDNGVRPQTTPESLAKLPPVFDRPHGTVTAGNASQLTDGAVALLVMSEAKANALHLTPLGRLSHYAYAGCDPARMGLGPVPALKKAGRPLVEADVVEINEAFAAQVLAVLQDLAPLGGVPDEKLNPHGGAIALGHPVGATGARLVLSVLHQLRRTHGRAGVATLCVGGGQGGAVWLERL
jgi:acetyl-CoA acetyltransferase family protein